MKHEDNIKKAIDALDAQLANGQNPPEALNQSVNELNQTLFALRKQWLSNSWNWAKRLVLGAKIVGLLLAIGVSSAWYTMNKKSKMPNENLTMLSMDSLQLTNLEVDTLTKVDAPKKLVQTIGGTIPFVPADQIESNNHYTFSFNEKAAEQDFIMLENTGYPEVEETQKSAKQDSLRNWLGKSYRKNDVFQIWANRDTILMAAQGTKISIPKNSFSPANKGLVTIKFKEFTNAYEMFQGRINTNCKQGLLQSAGSCFIEAFDEGKAIEISKGKEISFQFKADSLEDYQTFEQDQSTDVFAWKTTISPVVKRNPFNIELKDASIGYVRVKSKSPVNSIIKMKLVKMNPETKTNIQSNINYNTSRGVNIAKFQFRKTKVSGADVDELIMIKGNRILVQYFMKMDLWNYKFTKKLKKLGIDSICMDYALNANGEVTKFYLDPLTNKRQFRKITRKLKRYEKTQVFEKDSTIERIRVVFRPMDVQTSITMENGKSDLPGYEEEGIELKSIISTSNLGYINCDRFSNSKITQQLMIQTGVDSGLQYIYLPEINGLLQIYNKIIDFPLGNGVSANYLGVFALEDGLYMRMQNNLPIGNRAFIQAPMVPYDEEKVKAFLLSR